VVLGPETWEWHCLWGPVCFDSCCSDSIADDVYASVGCTENHVTVNSKSAGKCRSGYLETMITQDTSVMSLNAAQLLGAI
jgi:hypothetical protein